MKVMWFRIAQNGAFVPCPRPIKQNRFVVEVTDIPDNLNHADVIAKLNNTAIYGVSTVSYDQLGAGKLIKSWGGAREGAGRPSTGRNKRQFYVTDEEEKKLRDYLNLLRSDIAGDKKSSMIEVKMRDGRVGQLIDIQIKNEAGESPLYLVDFEDESMDWFSAEELEDRY